MNSRYIWPEVLRREKVVSLRSWYHYPVTDPMVRKSLQFGGPDLQVAQIAPVLLNCSSTVAHIIIIIIPLSSHIEPSSWRASNYTRSFGSFSPLPHFIIFFILSRSLMF